MSQASKHVQWCISKARKELEECEKLGKRKKHRGLLEVEPDVDEARRHLEKARHNLKAVMLMRDGGLSDWSIMAGFYACYHCFLAVAAKFGYESGNQSCTMMLIEYLHEEGKIHIDKKFVDLLKYADSDDETQGSIIELREEYTYGIKTSFEDVTKIDDLISDCKELLEATKEIIFS